MGGFLLQILGGLLIALVLADVFLTVLYARIHVGIISHRLACWTWQVFRAVSRLFGRWRETVLSFCGPVILVLLVAVWFMGIAIGSAMIIQPKLGSSVRVNSGETPTDFITALYIAGDSMTTVGASDIAPRTPWFRMLHTFDSFIGISMLTLTLTYFLEIYNSLQRRNTFALKMHWASDETGDAAELLAGLGPTNKFEPGYTHLAEMAAEMAAFKESHHFYSVLFYFRFREPHYALSRISLVCLDLVTLIKSALSDDDHGWLKESAAVTQLWRASMHLETVLAVSFLPQGLPQEPEPDAQALERWRRRYLAALRRLRQAGIRTIEDENIGVQNYLALRARWDRYIKAFSAHLAHEIDQVDPAGSNPEQADDREDFQVKLRSAG